MRKVIYTYHKDTKKYTNKVYDTEKATFICNTPQGNLYKKRGSSQAFFIWGKDDPYEIEWADANNLVKTYGTREQHINLFTTFGASKDQRDGGVTSVNIDSYHRLKAWRNAQRLHLSLQAYIYRLIDKDDSNNNYCK